MSEMILTESDLFTLTKTYTEKSNIELDKVNKNYISVNEVIQDLEKAIQLLRIIEKLRTDETEVKDNKDQ